MPDSNFLHESLAICLREVYHIEVWYNFASHFPHIIRKELEIKFLDEVDSFRLHYIKIVKEQANSGLHIIQRWKLLRPDYPLLFEVARALLAIPYSSSTVESLFSELKCFETASRNRLTAENLEANILADQYFRSKTAQILPDMVSRYFTLWDEDKKHTDTTHSKEVKDKVDEIKYPIIIEEKEKNVQWKIYLKYASDVSSGE